MCFWTALLSPEPIPTKSDRLLDHLLYSEHCTVDLIDDDLRTDR